MLIQSSEKSIRGCLAENSHVNSTVILQLIDDDDWAISHSASQNPVISSSQLTLLLKKKLPIQVLAGIAHNPNATAESLRLLYNKLEASDYSEDQCFSVIESIAVHGNCPFKLLSEMLDGVVENQFFYYALTRKVLTKGACPDDLLLEFYQRVMELAAIPGYSLDLAIDTTSSPRHANTRTGSTVPICCGAVIARTARSRTRPWAISPICQMRWSI